MYLRELRLRNIRSFEKLSITFPEIRPDGNWCVILGDNGVGKSTILRAIALALVSDRTAARLLPNPAAWLKSGAGNGDCEAILTGERHPTEEYPVKYLLTGAKRPTDEASLAHTKPFPRAFTEERDRSLMAGYGPFRRPEEGPRRESTHDLEVAFRSLFDDAATMRGLEDWLLRLALAASEKGSHPEGKRKYYERLLNLVIEVIDSLWPAEGKVRLSISAAGLSFIGPHKERTSLADLSDGYRAVFALACDLLRHAVTAIEIDQTAPVTRSTLLEITGIVLIDEIDVHLHPKWQREIGFYLQRTFPRIQFIVATHSPFVAQAATPDGVIVLQRDPKSGKVSPDTSLASLRGVPAEDILQSRVFDLAMTLDPETEAKLARHAKLAARRQKGGLNKSSTAEMDRLESELAHLLHDSEEDPVLQRLDQLLHEAQRKHD